MRRRTRKAKPRQKNPTRHVITEPTALSLGVDPGLNSGAAVWVKGSTVIAACSWLRLKRKKSPDAWRMDYAQAETTCSDLHGSLPDALRNVRPRFASFVAIEGQYHAPRGRLGPGQASAFTVARTAGLCWGFLSPTVEPVIPLASSWRTAIGASGLTANDAEVAAWTFAHGHFAWPGELGDWFDGLTVVQSGAVAEAAVMAVARLLD